MGDAQAGLPSVGWAAKPSLVRDALGFAALSPAYGASYEATAT